MVKQERAQQTRRCLILAAAKVFDEHGYAGTSLSRVVKSAGGTMGALTFHFPTKHELAEAVAGFGASMVRAALMEDARNAVPGLQGVIDLTHTLARLLEEEATVRATARLAREHAGAEAIWHTAWAPALQDHLDRAVNGDAPPQEPTRRAITALVQHLVAGSEAMLQSSAPTLTVQPPSAQPSDPSSTCQKANGRPSEQLALVWELMLSDALSPLGTKGLDPHGSR